MLLGDRKVVDRAAASCSIMMLATTVRPVLCSAQLNIYREQSELLDPLLEDITTALTVGLSEAAKAPAFWRCVELQRTAPLLWTLASTRCLALHK